MEPPSAGQLALPLLSFAGTSMPQDVTIASMKASHLEDALKLSVHVGWPHKLDDWKLMLGLSEGFIAQQDGAIVGTAMMTPFGDDAAAINMVIVDETMRGRGVGRQLMQTALDAAGSRSCFLVATQSGQPLYEKLGFVAFGEISQYQRGQTNQTTTSTRSNVSWVEPDEREAITELDCLARGFERSKLIEALHEHGRCCVIRENAVFSGFAAIRRFGRGLVIGPVVAQSDEQAKALISFLLSHHGDEFVRIDIDVSNNLGLWLNENGFVSVGGGIHMQRGKIANALGASRYKSFALASQALG